MSRMSARFVAQKVGMTTNWVYNMWKEMGLVEKDKFGDWVVTAAGRAIGGKCHPEVDLKFLHSILK